MFPWLTLGVLSTTFTVPYDSSGALHGRLWRGSANASTCLVFIPGGPSFPLVDYFDDVFDGSSEHDFDFVGFDFCGTGRSTCTTDAGFDGLARQAEAIYERVHADVCRERTPVIVGYSYGADTVVRMNKTMTHRSIFFLPFVQYYESVSVRNQCVGEYVMNDYMLPEIIRRTVGFLLCGYYCDENDVLLCGLRTLLTSWVPQSTTLVVDALEAERFRQNNFYEYTSLDLTSTPYHLNHTFFVTSPYDFIAPARFARQMYDNVESSCKTWMSVTNIGHFVILSRPNDALTLMSYVLDHWTSCGAELTHTV